MKKIIFSFIKIIILPDNTCTNTAVTLARSGLQVYFPESSEDALIISRLLELNLLLFSVTTDTPPLGES